MKRAQEYEVRDLAGVEFLVGHHSGVDVDSTAASVADYHVDTLGWPGIGYHLLVHWDGRIEYVGDFMELRFNVARQNHRVIGVCLLGDYTSREPRPKQMTAAVALFRELKKLFPGRKVVGHREVALPGYWSPCPGETFLSGPTWKNYLLAA